MSVNIDSFKRKVEFIMNKTQSGNSYKPSQFNDICHMAQMQIFEKDYQNFIETENISDYLNVFMKNKVGSVSSSGEYILPIDLQHLASVRKYLVRPNGKSVMIHVREVDNVSWGLTQLSSLREPSLLFPKYTTKGSKLFFVPKDIGLIELDYFKMPIAPVWGFTIVSGRMVYDPSTSTDFEWDEHSTNLIISIFLPLVGCNLKDQELFNFSQMYKQQISEE